MWLGEVANNAIKGDLDRSRTAIREYKDIFAPGHFFLELQENGLAPQKVAKTQDVVKEGDKVKVKFMGFDDRGKTKLSMKVVDQTTGEDITDKINAERAERGEPPLSEDTGGRPKRDGDGGGRGRRPRRD